VITYPGKKDGGVGDRERMTWAEEGLVGGYVEQK